MSKVFFTICYSILVGVYCTFVLIVYNFSDSNLLSFKHSGLIVYSATIFLILFSLFFSYFHSMQFYQSDKKYQNLLKRLADSKQKYRHIIDNTHDILFTIDENLIVKTVNRAVTPQLGILPRTLIGKYLLDIIFFQAKEAENTDRDILLEKIENLKKKRKKIRFRTNFIIDATGETKPFLLELAYTGMANKTAKSNIIFGRAQSEPMDTLIPSFIKERHSYQIGNSLIEAEEISRRITHNLNKYLANTKVESIRMAARELILNAIEHGNLEISFEEKRDALNQDRYMDLFQERKHTYAHEHRKVQIHALINKQYFIMRIEDQGQGFDYKSLLAKRSAQNLGLHGRGLQLVLSEFGKIDFNKKGNRITATYRFSPEQ